MNTDPSTTMRFFRHAADGLICWTYPDTPHIHYRSPREQEHPGVTHCGYPHDNPDLLTELPEKHARTLLNPDTGRSDLINRIHTAIDWDFVEVFKGEGEPGYPTPRALSAHLADTLITAEITP